MSLSLLYSYFRSDTTAETVPDRKRIENRTAAKFHCKVVPARKCDVESNICKNCTSLLFFQNYYGHRRKDRVTGAHRKLENKEIFQIVDKIAANTFSGISFIGESVYEISSYTKLVIPYNTKAGLIVLLKISDQNTITLRRPFGNSTRCADGC